MLIKILSVVALVIYAAFNLYAAKVFSARQMKENFVNGQCAVGKVFVNIFYAPAWVLKVIRIVVVMFIK